MNRQTDRHTERQIDVSDQGLKYLIMDRLLFSTKLISKCWIAYEKAKATIDLFLFVCIMNITTAVFAFEKGSQTFASSVWN